MDSPPVATQSGAALIANALYQLGVRVIFGLVGIPVVQIAEEAAALGIRFIAFRNEQAASYAATAYGYLTGKPGVCLVVGGPGVLHAMAGVGNSSANAFPMLLLAGSCETRLITRGAFQELDAVSLLTPHTKISIRATLESISYALTHAYRMAGYGRAGTGFVDLPADVIQGKSLPQSKSPVPAAPRAGADPQQLARVAELIKTARAPLIVVGKGAAYARAEVTIQALVDQTDIPFLPTPMGKGVLPDSHPLNVSSARSAALKNADVVLLLGARLNWILHFGDDSKWSADATFIQVDSSAEEIGHNNHSNQEQGLLGDIKIVTAQLIAALQGWKYDLSLPYMATSIRQSREKNEKNAAKAAERQSNPMNYHQVFNIIKHTLQTLSPTEEGHLVYVSEGANTMDISRSIFPVEHPRRRLDAGTHATMGVGLGYAIAAHCAYNLSDSEQLPEEAGSGETTTTISTTRKKRKIICLEGDSAFGFSMAEVETMSRYRMDILIFVLNNSGIYHGDCAEADEWSKLQTVTTTTTTTTTTTAGENSPAATAPAAPAPRGLRSTSLGWQIGYEKMAEMCGGKGFLVRTPEELEHATVEGFRADVPVVVNIIIESGHEKRLEFAWQKTSSTGSSGKEAEIPKTEENIVSSVQ